MGFVLLIYDAILSDIFAISDAFYIGTVLEYFPVADLSFTPRYLVKNRRW